MLPDCVDIEGVAVFDRFTCSLDLVKARGGVIDRCQRGVCRRASMFGRSDAFLP